MIVATMKLQTGSDGKRFLHGTALIQIEKGWPLVLKRLDDETWQLWEVGPREINTDPETLPSFCLMD